jgi:hypothetical protein
MSTFAAGLDLGQSQDHTGLVIVERLEEEGGARYDVRHLERFKLGTGYPTIVAVVTDLLKQEPLSEKAPLIVDGTGVGRAVVEMLGRPRGGLVPVTITGGEATVFEKGYWHVPKRELVGVVQSLLQTRKLKFAEGLPLVSTLVKELLGFQIKISAAAHDTYGNWRDGEHDDLVLGLALCLWYQARAPRFRPTSMAGERRPSGRQETPMDQFAHMLPGATGRRH